MTVMTREQALKHMQMWLDDRESVSVGEESEADSALTRAAQWAQIAEALREDHPNPTPPPNRTQPLIRNKTDEVPPWTETW